MTKEEFARSLPEEWLWEGLFWLGESSLQEYCAVFKVEGGDDIEDQKALLDADCATLDIVYERVKSQPMPEKCYTCEDIKTIAGNGCGYSGRPSI